MLCFFASFNPGTCAFRWEYGWDRVLRGDVGWGWSGGPKTLKNPKKPHFLPKNPKKPQKMPKKPENPAFFNPFLGHFGPYLCSDTFFGQFRASPALGWEFAK